AFFRRSSLLLRQRNESSTAACPPDRQPSAHGPHWGRRSELPIVQSITVEPIHRSYIFSCMVRICSTDFNTVFREAEPSSFRTVQILWFIKIKRIFFGRLPGLFRRFVCQSCVRVK